MNKPLTDEELTYYERRALLTREEHLRLVADLRELREAVGPFVRLAQGLREDYIDEGILYVSSQALRLPNTAFTAGDLRRLAACLPKRRE